MTSDSGVVVVVVVVRVTTSCKDVTHALSSSSSSSSYLIHGPNIDIIGLQILSMDIVNSELDPFVPQPFAGPDFIVGKDILIEKRGGERGQGGNDD